MVKTELTIMLKAMMTADTIIGNYCFWAMASVNS